MTLAVARRVLTQIRRDRRTLALILIMPTVLMALLAWVLGDLFDRIAPALFAFFPFTVMFLVTSITTLGERNSGTLERTLTMPVARASIIGGYALAFALLAVVQTAISVVVSFWLLGLEIGGSVPAFVGVALGDALVGTAMGLAASAFARTEFQAVQFMPAFVLPQFLLCGLLVPRDELPTALEWLSNVLPLSYAVDAMQKITAGETGIGADLAVLAAFFVAFIALAAASMPRRTA